MAELDAKNFEDVLFYLEVFNSLHIENMFFEVTKLINLKKKLSFVVLVAIK